MKQILLIVSIFSFFTCNNSTSKELSNNGVAQNAKDSLISINVDSFWLDENEIHSGEYKQFYSCQFGEILNDPKTPKLAKDIYLDNEWNLNNDDEALALLDCLTAKNITSRPFYFKVITKSYKKSDGAYLEALGLTGYEFVKKHTQEFASYFDDRMCYIDQDLYTWTEIIFGEFAISSESNYSKSIVDEYIKTLKKNCEDCSITQKETINEFGVMLQEKMLQ